MGAVASVIGAPTRATIPLNKLAPEAALRRLELTIVRRLEGFLHGDHLGLLPGPGSEISDARIYVPGEDDVRRIDWAVTARTTVPYVRDTISDRELEVWALLDVTPSMNWGTEGVTKRDLGIAAVATIGFLSQKMGDRFGGYIMRPDSLRRLPARSGRSRPLRAAAQDADRAVRARPRHRADDAGGECRAAVPDPAAPRVAGSGVGLPDPGRSRAGPERRARVGALDAPARRTQPGAGGRGGRPKGDRVPRRRRHADPRSGDRLRALREHRRLDARARMDAASAAQRERIRISLRRAGVGHIQLRTDRDWVQDIARFVLAYRRVASMLHAPPQGVTK